MAQDFFNFSIPTKVYFGDGITNRLGEELAFLGPKKAILITDKVMQKIGMVNRVQKGLHDGPLQIVAVFDDVPPNSELAVVTAAAELGKAKNADCVMALGGGSVMDTAKVVNILLTKGGQVQDHMGAQLINEKLLPSIFIPTTAGTGAEVTQFAVILDSKKNLKLPFSENAIIPDIAILDPELTKSMPSKLTAATGMDALTHAIEAYVSTESNPATEAFALRAIELISSNILQAAAVPDDMEARGAMLSASFMAGAAFSTSGVGIVHAISHALGGVYHIPHGLANSILLPLGIEYNLESSVPKFARIAEAMGETSWQPIGELQKTFSSMGASFMNTAFENLDFFDEWLMNQRANRVPVKIRELNRKLKFIAKLETNLKEAGVKDNLGKINELVKAALNDGSVLYNPTEVTEKGVRQILDRAYKQDLPAWPMQPSDFKIARMKTIKNRPKNVFDDSEKLYNAFIPFFEELRDNAQVGPKLKEAGICIRFNYTDPDASLVIDGAAEHVRFLKADEARQAKVDIEMSMKADFAHYFWHGKANVLQALARREVVTKGNLPNAMRLLPILDPAYSLYPAFLRRNGLGSIVVD